MMPQEQVLFSDRAVYISNTRLVLRKGGTYPIANLAQVTLGRVAASRSWIGLLVFGLIFLASGAVLNQHFFQAIDNMFFNSKPYLVIGCSLLLMSFISLIFQITCPLYVVVLKGTFGTARPIKYRNRRYILKVVTALNQALSQRDLPVSPTIIKSTQIGQIIQDWSHRSNDIIIGGQGAQVNIGTSGHAQNIKETSDIRRSVFSPPAFNESSLYTLSQSAPIVPSSGALDTSGVPGWADLSGLTDTGARKIIISYSHQDHQWLDLLRMHLALLERQQTIALWDDTRIAAGMQKRQVMSDALKAADFALLLVSANFLASEVITRYELPQILWRLSQGRFTILPLILSPCLYHESPLGSYQPFNPNNPLSRLSPPERDDIMVRVAREIQKAVS